MNTLVQALGLTKKYKNVTALKDINIKISEGVSGIIGPNGSGKSTFLKILVGLLRKYEGIVTIFEKNIRNQKELEGIKKQIGFAGENLAYPRNFKIKAFLTHIAKIKGIRKALEEVSYFSELLEIDKYENKKINELSAGMEQRVAIACALLGNPRLVILDEPFKSLDQDGRIILQDIIKELKKHQSFIISSHDLRELQEVIENAILFKYGSIVYSGELSTLMLTVKEVTIKIKIASIQENFSSQIKKTFPTIRSIEKKNQFYLIRTILDNKDIGRFLEYLTTKFDAKIISVERGNLVEKYKEMYREENK